METPKSEPQKPGTFRLGGGIIYGGLLIIAGVLAAFVARAPVGDVKELATIALGTFSTAFGVAVAHYFKT